VKENEHRKEKIIFVLVFVQTCPERVQFVVSRTSRPQTPDLIRSTSVELAKHGGLSLDCEPPVTPLLNVCKERLITINKVSQDRGFIFFTINKVSQ
jgi:hypothetical protein